MTYKYKCTHCRHRQETTDMGMCEVCDYENLVEIDPNEDLKELVEEWKNLLEMRQKASDHNKCPHCMEQLLFCGCIAERAEEILTYGGIEKILNMLELDEGFEKAMVGTSTAFSMKAVHERKLPYNEDRKFKGAFTQGYFDEDSSARLPRVLPPVPKSQRRK